MPVSRARLSVQSVTRRGRSARANTRRHPSESSSHLRIRPSQAHIFASARVKLTSSHPSESSSHLRTRPSQAHIFAPVRVKLTSSHPSESSSHLRTRPSQAHIFTPVRVKLTSTDSNRLCIGSSACHGCIGTREEREREEREREERERGERATGTPHSLLNQGD
jgi:hypothetical protein